MNFQNEAAHQAGLQDVPKLLHPYDRTSETLFLVNFYLFLPFQFNFLWRGVSWLLFERTHALQWNITICGFFGSHLLCMHFRNAVFFFLGFNHLGNARRFSICSSWFGFTSIGFTCADRGYKIFMNLWICAMRLSLYTMHYLLSSTLQQWSRFTYNSEYICYRIFLLLTCFPLCLWIHLEAIESGRLPGDILDDIPCKFVDGTLVCEVSHPWNFTSELYYAQFGSSK